MTGELTFRPSAADTVAANRAQLLAMWLRGRTWRAWLAMIALMSGMGAAVGYWIGGAEFVPEVTRQYALLGVALMPVMHLISFTVTVPIRIRRIFAQQSSATLVQHWRWSDDGLEIDNAQGSARHGWGDLFGWRIMRGMLLLYVNEKVFYALPRSAIAPDAWQSLTDTIRGSTLRRF